jgi:hypothetical protein
MVLLQATGLQADSTLRDHDNLSVLLAASNDEATFTNYTRKVLSSGVTVTVDDSNDWLDVDIADQTWTSAGGTTNNSIGKLLMAYDPDTTSGTDTTIIPVSAHDLVFTTDGSSVVAEIAAGGFLRAA